MGTSRNDRSPNIPTWRPVASILGRPEVSPDRQSQEIWRAAFGERGERLIADFCRPAMVDLLRVAASNPAPATAMEKFDHVVHERADAGVVLDFARRALIRSSATQGGITGFVSELFGEVSGYYVSRDLPSFVGASDRISNVSRAIELKSTIKQIVQNAAISAGTPQPEKRSWELYVSEVVDRLKGTR